MRLPEVCSRLSDGLNHVAIAVCAATVVIMLSMTTVGLFYRVVLGSELTWAYSLTRLFLPWLAMLSITVAFKGGEHIAITFAVRKLPPKALKAVRAVNLALVGLFGAALAWYGYSFFENSTQLHMVSDLLQVSQKWTAASVPVAGLVMCVHLLGGASLVDHHDLAEEDEP